MAIGDNPGSDDADSSWPMINTRSENWLTFDSLRLRLMASFLLLTIIPLTLVGALTGYRSTASLEQQSLALQREITARVGRELVAFVDQRMNELRLLDDLLGLATLNRTAQKANLRQLLMRDQNYQELILLEATGQERIRLSRTDVVRPIHLIDRGRTDEFLAPAVKRKTYFGPIRFDPTLREPLFKVALPIVDRHTDQIRNVLIAEIRFKKIWSLLARIRLPESIDVYVTNSAGRVVAHKNPATILRGTTLSLAERQNWTTNPDGEDAIVVSHTLAFGDRPLVVLAMQPVFEALQLATSNFWLTLIITLAALLIAVLLGVVLTHQLVKPIECLADTARTVSRGDLSVQITPEGRGEIGELSAAFQAMTERLKTMIAELESAEYAATKRAQVTLESIGDAVITTDADGSVNYLNPVAQTLTGWSLADAYGQPLERVFHIINEYSRERAPNPVARCLIEDKIIGLANHTVLISRQGYEYAIQDSAAPIRDRSGTIFGVVLVFSDVTEARQLQREMSHQARHDALTGLVNRHEFEHRLQRVIETAKAEQTEHALCYLDLDQFKVVNDTCGHAAGDELLRQVTTLFRHRVRKRDILGRLGGDEFAVLIEHCDLDQAQRIANSLRQAMEDFRFGWQTQTFTIGVSIGLVPINVNSEDATAVLRAADSACYVAKDAGRNRIHVYHEDDAALTRRHSEMRWVATINRALEEDRFQLYAQPIRPIGRQPNPVNHYELLLRLVDDNDRTILPGAFLPAAERYNLAVRIDRWTINAAFRWLAQLPPERADVVYAINLSGQSLSDNDFLAYVNQQLNEMGIAPGRICFEITETAAIANLASAMHFISSLRQRGCQFALDDFGSGLSSFAYLKTLPVDFLKIDGVFVKDIVDDPLDLAMVRSINEIGQLMGMQTIAEFVENNTILAKLRELGVNYAQGYMIGQPRPLIIRL